MGEEEEGEEEEEEEEEEVEGEEVWLPLLHPPQVVVSSLH